MLLKNSPLRCDGCFAALPMVRTGRGILLLWCFLLHPLVWADEPHYTFSVSAQPLDQALLELSSQARVNVLGLSRALEGLQSAPVEGSMSLDQALGRMLANVPLSYELLESGSVIIQAPTPAPTSAEPETPVIVEERPTYDILVTGIRQSLRTSAEFKRLAPVIVDTITAEDAGKFPDPNVAEALQRVTGVQISRDRGGEGRWVSVRGLSSQYNMTTLNGRTLATDNAGRDFSFDVMPSESIASARVYKTAMASLPEGSIGGLVDLQTTQPLDDPGFRGHGSVGGFFDGATHQWTEQYAGTLQNSFRDDTLGISIGGSYYQRDWEADTYDSFVSGTEPVDANGDGVRDEMQDGFGVYPGIISFQKKFGQRERLGITGALQYQPNNDFEVLLDTFYSHYKTPESAYSYNVNFYSNDGARRFSDAVLEAFDGGGQDRWLITDFALNDIPVEIGNDTKAREATTAMVGWNTRWRTNDNLTLTLDVAFSEADRPINGTEYYTVAGVKGGNFRFEAQDPVPRVRCTFDTGEPCLDVNNDSIALHFLEPKGENVNDQALSSRLEGRWVTNELNYLDDLQFGLIHTRRRKEKVDWRPSNPCAFCGFEDTLGEVGVTATVPFPGHYDYASGFDRWPALNPLALFEAAKAHRGDAFFERNILAKPRLRASSVINEDVSGAFVQFNLSGAHWVANLGGRWVTTDTLSRGHSQQLLELREIPGSTNWNPVFSDIVPVEESHRYRNFLPSFNASYEFTESLLGRVGLSRSMTRPTLSQLGPDVMWEVNSPPPRVERNGNPGLEPFIADSADLSLEWYGRGGSSMAAALFFKDIHGLITSDVFESDFSVQVVGVDGSETEEILTFDVSAPVNGTDARVQGVELAYQYLFDNGFGVMANMTWVNSDATLTSEEAQNHTELSGVSEYTYNLIGLYERRAFSGRLAWNYRGEFIACNTCGPGGVPTTTAAFGSLDFSLNYDLSKRLSLYAEGQNLLREDNHTYSVDRRLTNSYEAYSRRFELGIRFSF